VHSQTKSGIALALVLALVGAFVVSELFGKESSKGRDENATETGSTIPSPADPEAVETLKESSASESAVPVTEVPASRPARKDASLNVKAFQSPEEYIELLQRYPFTFESAVQPFGQDAVQPLLAILDDPDYMQYWNQVSFAIVLIDREHESCEALLRYIRRSDDWRSRLREDQLFSYVVGKMSTIERLGLVGDQEALHVAKSALTEAGARALVGEWFDDYVAHSGRSPERLVAMIQGSAARGIVHAGDAAGIRQVEDLYALLSSASENSLPETPDVSTMLARLVVALAARDLIRDVGMESYLDIMTDYHEFGYVITGYEQKYWQEVRGKQGKNKQGELGGH